MPIVGGANVHSLCRKRFSRLYGIPWYTNLRKSNSFQSGSGFTVTATSARIAGGSVYPVFLPGGSTIITTVVEVLVNRIDGGMTLPEAIAAPRATQRNTSTVGAEADFRATLGAGLAVHPSETEIIVAREEAPNIDLMAGVLRQPK